MTNWWHPFTVIDIIMVVMGETWIHIDGDTGRPHIYVRAAYTETDPSATRKSDKFKSEVCQDIKCDSTMHDIPITGASYV